MNKIIFLDIDGVLNMLSKQSDQYGALFEKRYVDNLAEIVEKTGAKIVISSSWRTLGIEHMRNMWKHRNLPGEIVDITPDLADFKLVGETKLWVSPERGKEINAWLDKNPTKDFIILDDEESFSDENLKDRFLKTSGNIFDKDSYMGFGLINSIKEKAIKILNNENKI